MLKNNYCDCFLTQNNYLWFTNYSIMKKVLSAIAFVLISSMTFTSCITEEKDNTGPQIEIVTPEDGEVFALGDVMELHLKFKDRSEEHTSELQSRENLVCRLLLEKTNKDPNSQARLRRKEPAHG